MLWSPCATHLIPLKLQNQFDLRFLIGILGHLGAIGTGGTKKQTAEMMIPKKSGGANKGSTRPASSNFGIDFDGII